MSHLANADPIWKCKVTKCKLRSHLCYKLKRTIFESNSPSQEQLKRLYFFWKPGISIFNWLRATKVKLSDKLQPITTSYLPFHVISVTAVRNQRAISNGGESYFSTSFSFQFQFHLIINLYYIQYYTNTLQIIPYQINNI